MATSNLPVRLYLWIWNTNIDIILRDPYITQNCQFLCFNPHQPPLEYDRTVGAERPRTWGGSTVNLGRNDRTWGGHGADRPGADRLWGGSTGTH